MDQTKAAAAEIVLRATESAAIEERRRNSCGSLEFSTNVWAEYLVHLKFFHINSSVRLWAVQLTQHARLVTP